MIRNQSKVVGGAINFKLIGVGFLIFAIMCAASVQAGVHPKNAAPSTGASSGTPVTEGIEAATTITNGIVTLGVNPEGNLITGGIGLTYVPTSGEALAPGCACEGWGVGDALTMDYGKAGESFGDANLVVELFETTAVSAISVVRVVDGTDLFRITHEYYPSASPNLFEVDVTVENLRAVDTTVRYRRAMDWDVPPTEFDELVTLITNGATHIIYSSDDGFADGNPFAGPSFLDFEGEATDSGPSDHGALFDFDFGTLGPGSTAGFTIFYGASANQDEALAALGAVGAEIYSLGKANPADDAVGDDGSPNTFIFGFAGVGGTAIDDAPSLAPTVPVPGLAPIGAGLMVLILGYFGVRRMRRV
jgi:hypothetical protein